MGIIFKFALKNVLEKKFRTFLIVFSITMSAALFFASTCMSGTMEKIILNRIKSSSGSAEIIMYANDKSPSSSIKSKSLDQYKDDLDYIVGLIRGNGIYETDDNEEINIDLQGYDWTELQKMNPSYLIEKNDMSDFSGKKIVLSKTTCDKYGFKLNDSISLMIGKSKYKLKIWAIANPIGSFMSDGKSNMAIVPVGFLEGPFNMKGSYSMIYTKPKDLSKTQYYIDEISKLYNRYTVKEVIPIKDIQRGTSQFTTPFMMMLLLVLAISTFIIYTSFRVITAEMLPVIGTFRSLGATKKMTDFVLMAQSLIYGVLGGLIGCGTGIGILYIMASTLLTEADKVAGFKIDLSYSPYSLMAAFALAILLAIFSSLMPIIKVSKISVKDIVLNTVENTKKKQPWKPIVGVILLTLAYILPTLAPRNLAIIVTMFSCLAVTNSIEFIVPTAMNVFIKIFEKLYMVIFGSEGVLAAKNLRENRSVLNNISLLSMGISAILIINTMSVSVIKEIGNAYRDMTYDIELRIGGGDKSTIRTLESVDGVNQVYGNTVYQGIEVAGSKDQIQMVMGVNKLKFGNFFEFNLEGNQEELFKELDYDRNIIITNALAYKFDLKKDDLITLKTKKGDRPYKVIGFMNTIYYNGQTALISDRYLKSDMEIKYFNQILVKTHKPPEEVLENIKDKFGNKNVNLFTIDQMEKLNMEGNANVFKIFNLFSYFTMIIGIFGVLNNFAISFIERKRGLAIMKSVGMSKAQTIKMIFIEALTGGLIGGFVGTVSGLVLLHIIPFMMKALDMDIPIHYDVKMILLSVLSGAVVTLIAAISPALKSSKMNIIDAIKYE